LDALCRMTHAGLGIAVMPQQVAELYLQALDVVVRPLSDDWARRQLCIVFPSQAQLSATANGEGGFRQRVPTAGSDNAGRQPCCDSNRTSFQAVADSCAWLGNTMQ
ncbi:hypothetical protein LLE87_29685, partial [Paenibacillus polymyxa]|nr:hypothetical protein [Paenibacillus polymyxa]